MAKKETKSQYGFEIPEDYDEQFDHKELYKVIRDNKKIYASTTFLRAIPFNKDGLVEVYRRGLYDLLVNKHTHNAPTVKSALVVGDIIGRYHPHGDQSAYKSLVTLSQPWTNNYPLVYGKGNWGNVLGDPQAHYRYTECKLSEFFDDVCEDINEHYVDYVPNFDNSTKEVKYLPFKIPILLVNGSYGIADAYMASILPHNLCDVVELCKKYIANPNISNYELVEGFYPDFPNYGIITNKSEIEYNYRFNVQGNCKMKATMEIDRLNNKIIIKDLPYGVVLHDIQRILKTQFEKKHAVLSKILNIIEIKTNRDDHMHIEYEVIFDKNSNILEIARDLEKYCLLKTVPINHIMYDGEYVNNASIKNIVEEWYQTLSTTKLRRISYHSSLYNTKKHILEGMLSIYDHIDEVIDYAKKSGSKDDLINYLSKNFGLTDIQSKAIAEMQIYNIARSGKQNIIDNIKDYEAKIAELDEKLLHVDDEIINDLEFLKRKYGRPRRTLVIDADEEKGETTQIPMSNGAVLWSHNQYALFDMNNIINGKALMNGLKSVKINGKNTKEIIGCHNVNGDLIGVLIFMSDGTAKRIEVKDIVGLNNWITIADEPIISGIIPIYSEEDKFIVLSDSNKIKISTVDQFKKQAVTTGNIKLVERLDKSKDSVLFTTESGKYHMININDIPELGRSATGVMIDLPDNEIIAMHQLERHSDETPIFSIIDDEGYSYIMRLEQEYIEDTNRSNKPKRLFEIDKSFKVVNVNSIDISKKDYKMVLIGKYSSSQMSILTVKLSDMNKIPKKVPVQTLGIISYKL